MSRTLISNRRLRTIVGGTAVAAALATGLSACGSSGANGSTTAVTPLAGLAPAAAVKTAFENLGEASTVHAKVHLDLSQGAADSMTKGADAMTPVQAAALRNGSLDYTVTAPQGQTLAQAMTASKDKQEKDPGAFDFTVNTDQGPLVGFRTVGGNLYAKADLGQMSTLAGTDLSKGATALGRQSAGLGTIMSAVVGGKWLEVSNSELKALQGMFALGAGVSGFNPDLVTGLQKDLETALTNDVAWTAGTTPGTYDATLAVNKLASDLYADVQKLDSAIGQPLPSEKQFLAKIPAGTNVSVQIATTGDQVSSITLDALQFDHDPADLKELGADPKIDIVATFDTTSAPVTAPSDAVLLDKQIPSLLMGLGASGA